MKSNRVLFEERLKMPMSWQDAMVLSMLVCCVPIQYWISQHASVSQDQRTAEVYRLVDQSHTWARRWLTVTSWRDWLIGIQQKYFAEDYSHWYLVDDSKNPLGECPAVEVWTYRQPEGAFGMSPRPRNMRPKYVKWRVGQVVKHNLRGYKGVIIGWDIKAKAPEEWIQMMHMDKKHWRDQPQYTLLVDAKDRPAEITYVPQENITPIINTEVDHPDLYNFFDTFDGAQYIPRPWLRAVYPMD
ncbi:hypothetical protein Pcinc_011309 [Petrolisthes cinctipes]|uniref:Hemimethylated DNA-binding domain-containing protein n=1 Tax=Petrolisthes cinctipes TaxID=88211 RepID=A0AAE1G332_PETCI|nr:hypothetical protein Pcinc_011309 [Petrolisthes cinctipes]